MNTTYGSNKCKSELKYLIHRLRSRNYSSMANVKYMVDYIEATERLKKFNIMLSVKDHSVRMGTISFTHTQLKKFPSLKCYVGDYGFVVTVKGGRSEKILKGEKPLWYKEM